MPIEAPCPLLGFVAFSGTGKTTLLEKLIPILKGRGLRIGLLKHGHHDFDIDHPGKDSYRLRQAGAGQVMIASRKRWAMINENDLALPEPDLASLLPKFDTDTLDLLLVEGFKHERYPKIELRRASLQKPLLYPDDPDIIAMVCDEPETTRAPIPVLDLNRPETIAQFIDSHILNRSQDRSP